MQGFESAVGSIFTRRSIRRYLPKEVSEATVTQLLNAAVAAPSAHNRQPWRFAVLTQFADKHGLASSMANRLRADRARDGDAMEAIEADAARSYARLTGAPVVIVVALTLEDMDRYPDPRRTEAERLMAIQSTAMAVQNLLLSADAMKLGACWMCAPLFCRDTVQRALLLPESWEPQAIITLGYPADAGKPFRRRPLSEVVSFRNGRS